MLDAGRRSGARNRSHARCIHRERVREEPSETPYTVTLVMVFPGYEHVKARSWHYCVDDGRMHFKTRDNSRLAYKRD